jgi:hypothetical protein
MNKIVLFFVIIIIVLMNIFFVLNIYKKTTNIGVLPSPTVQPAQIIKGMQTGQMVAAEAYYTAFSGCMKNPPEETSGQVSTYCASHNEYAGKGLTTNLLKQNANVVCSQNLPKSAVAIRTTEINDEQALVILREDFSSTTTNVTYQMQKEKGEWKVENILCPK